MINDLELPEGKAIKVAKGGPEALKKVLLLLSRRGFTGYLKIESKDGSGTGFIVMREGSRAMTLFYGADGFLTGKAALPSFKELARERDNLIEVHTDQTLEPLIDSLEETQGKKPLPRGMGVFKRKLEEWKLKGHDVEDLEGVMGQSLSKVIKAFADYKEGMEKEESADLELLEPIEELPPSEDVDETKKGTKSRLKKLAPKKRTKKGKAKSDAEGPRVSEEVKEGAAPSAENGLIDRYTFETFIVGDSNRFAHAACLAIAEGSVDPYSPLFIVGGPGLGKTHLLHALGWRMVQKDGNAKLRYMTATQFRDLMEKASREGRLSEFRKSLLEHDTLLLDDVQDLAGKRVVQEELFAIFEDFHAKGKPIALAANRPPSEIQELDSRLISRFESGLVADIQAPNPEIRMGFLKSRIESRAISMQEQVLKYLADRFTFDLRELEGAVNKLVAYAQAVGKPVDLSLAKEALGPQTPAPAPKSAPKPGFDPIPGHSYLMKEERGDSAYSLLAKRIRHIKGLLITRTNPSRVKENYALDGAEILWLTDRSESTENTVGPVLERLMYKVESFMITGGQGMVILDGVEYLKSSNGFEAVLKFIRRLVDDISESDFTFILTVNPSTLDMRELRILENELETYPT